MKTQHTPGPWHVASDGYLSSDYGFLPIIMPFLRKANRTKHGGPSPEAAANARLIAAAPELLLALQKLVQAPNKHRPERLWKQACNAITKAIATKATAGD